MIHQKATYKVHKELGKPIARTNSLTISKLTDLIRNLSPGGQAFVNIYLPKLGGLKLRDWIRLSILQYMRIRIQEGMNVLLDLLDLLALETSDRFPANLNGKQ